jgi:hypothetical protein
MDAGHRAEIAIRDMNMDVVALRLCLYLSSIAISLSFSSHDDP